MTAVMLAGSAKGALPSNVCNDDSLARVEADFGSRRRPRVKSVEGEERYYRCSPPELFGEVQGCVRSRLFVSQSVDHGKEMHRCFRNRRSTEVSEFEELGARGKSDKGESGSEYDSEAVDSFDELNGLGFGNGIDQSVYTNASSLRSIQSNSEFKTRFSFPRKSSYISRNNTRPATGGLAKLLRQSDLTNEEKVDAQDNFLEEQVDVEEQERRFGFTKCTHCQQIYACERGGEEQEERGVLEDYKRSKYCSGECHLTHLSSLYEKQRKR